MKTTHNFFIYITILINNSTIDTETIFQTYIHQNRIVKWANLNITYTVITFYTSFWHTNILKKGQKKM